MSEEKSINQRCLEDILCHLTKMVVLTEHDEVNDLKQLVKMSTSVSAQLLGVMQNEGNEYINNETEAHNENDCKVNMSSEHISDYIKVRQGKLSKDEISLLIKNKQIDHLQFDHGKEKWQMWDNTGKFFEFSQRD